MYPASARAGKRPMAPSSTCTRRGSLRSTTLHLPQSSCCRGNTDDSPKTPYQVERPPRKIIGATHDYLRHTLVKNALYRACAGLLPGLRREVVPFSLRTRRALTRSLTFTTATIAPLERPAESNEL